MTLNSKMHSNNHSSLVYIFSNSVKASTSVLPLRNSFYHNLKNRVSRLIISKVILLLERNRAKASRWLLFKFLSLKLSMTTFWKANTSHSKGSDLWHLSRLPGLVIQNFYICDEWIGSHEFKQHSPADHWLQIEIRGWTLSNCNQIVIKLHWTVCLCVHSVCVHSVFVCVH